MRLSQLPAIILLALLAACQVAPDSLEPLNRQQPPVAKKIPHDVSVHGQRRSDDYYWLRDDTHSDPAVIAYLEAEQRYTQQEMASTAALQETLFQEMTRNVARDDTSIPYALRGYWYYSRYADDLEYPVYARRKDAEHATEQILFDLNSLAKGHDYFDLGGYAISPDNQFVAYATDVRGRGLYQIQLVDLASGEKLGDTLQDAEPQIVWANDNRTLFYIKQDPLTLLGYQIYRHRVGSPQADDVLVYEESDSEFYTWLQKSRDGSAIFLYHDKLSQSGISVLNADKPEDSFETLIPLTEAHRYSLARSGDDYFVLTNWEAKNYRLLRAPVTDVENRSRWTEVIPHREKVVIEDVLVQDNFIVLKERELGMLRIRVINRDTGRDSLLQFDDEIFVARFSERTDSATTQLLNPDPQNDHLRLYYSSLTTPETLYEFDLGSGDRKQLKQDKMANGFDPANYHSERIWITARDGAQVPVSVVYRKELFHKDGSNPIYIYGYGAYGLMQEPGFFSGNLPLLDRGFVYAVPHIRGGGMLGPGWYRDGRVLSKKNTFNDFVDATRALTERGYAHKDRVFASGRSAGGTLTAVLATTEPELYKGIIIGFPFVDVVTTMLDESIPLVTNEYGEWGDPRIREHYDYMLSYSPYDQVRARSYTNILVTTGFYDSQVQYYEPAKFVAKLRALKTDSNKLLFNVDMTSGHRGASGRYQAYREYALEYAFILDLLASP